MKKLLSTTAALTLVALLAACGGGGGGSVNPPPVDDGNTNPEPEPGTPTVGAPAATDAATLTAWAKNGGTTAPFENGVQRTTRTVTVDGVRHTVYVDSVNGYGDARVTYKNGADQTVFALVDNPAATGTAPTGVYTGEIDARWTPNATIGEQTGTGRIAIVLDAAAGTASIDSIIGGTAVNGTTTSNIEFIGGATASNGNLVADDISVRYRDGDGVFLHAEDGVLDGRIVAGTDTSGIFGTINADNASAGFSTGFSQTYTDELLNGN